MTEEGYIMLNLKRILQYDRLMRAMTELNRKAFEELLPSFSKAYCFYFPTTLIDGLCSYAH